MQCLENVVSMIVMKATRSGCNLIPTGGKERATLKTQDHPETFLAFAYSRVPQKPNIASKTSSQALG